LRLCLVNCADQLQLNIQPLPEAPAFGFDWQAIHE
jgi:hypothetical protein